VSALGRPDPKLVRIAVAAWEAAANGDRDALEALCAPDVVWHASGRGKWSGPRHGLDAMFEYLGALGEAADEFSSQLTDVLVSAGRAAVLFHVTGRRRSRTLETDFILLFETTRGRIQRIYSIPRDQLAVDEFWA
jgi:ketosteroid isomerase-like protein